MSCWSGSWSSRAAACFTRFASSSVRRFRRTKGFSLIWRDLQHVRDIALERLEPVSYPVMTDNLWR